MFGGCEQYFPQNANHIDLRGYENKCRHSQTVDDYTTGDCICSECGLVVENILSPASFQASTKISACQFRISEFLKDICANMQIADCVISHAVDRYNMIEKQLRKEKKGEKWHHIMAAYSLYETLDKLKIKKAPHEIALYSGISVKELFALQASGIIPLMQNDPTSYVDRYCAYLNLEYSHAFLIKEIVQKLDITGSYTSNCIVAVSIYLYCREKGIKKSLKEICETCTISPSNVHKVIRKIKIDHKTTVSNITK